MPVGRGEEAVGSNPATPTDRGRCSCRSGAPALRVQGFRTGFRLTASGGQEVASAAVRRPATRRAAFRSLMPVRVAGNQQVRDDRYRPLSAGDESAVLRLVTSEGGGKVGRRVEGPSERLRADDGRGGAFAEVECRPTHVNGLPLERTP